MKRLVAALLIIQLLACSGVVFAYEVLTHQDISTNAVTASVLQTDGTVLSNLGLKPLSDEQKFPNTEEQPRTIVQLFQDGSVFEDRSLFINPRYLNHFYDPVYDRPLTVLGVPLGEKSPDWALEDTGDVTGQGFLEQEFSFKEARQYFLNTLTKQSKGERDTYFGLTFQTLGQVIHHIQDMAQPQHVRNDLHPFHSDIADVTSSHFYEKYTDEVIGSLPFSGYNPVHFDTARKFWVTGTGQGIAEFTNNNFVSAGTNFTGSLSNIQSHPDYSLPDPQGLVLIETVNIKDLLSGTTLDGVLHFIGTLVNDEYDPSQEEFNLQTSTYSIFDPELTPTNQATFSLNRFNFDAAHQFLIPRAVAYSAGLIDYFFRGKIDMVPDPMNPLTP